MPSKTEHKQNVHKALAELIGFKVSDAPIKQVALFAGYKDRASKGFKNALKELDEEGMVYPMEKKAKTVRLTQQGVATAPSVSWPASNEDALLRIQSLLANVLSEEESRMAATILGILSDGKSHSIDSLFDAVNGV